MICTCWRRHLWCAVALVGLSVGSVSCAVLARPERMLYAGYCMPDSIEYAGSVFVYIRNPGAEPLTITGIAMDGKPVGKVWPTDETFLRPDVRERYIKIENDQLAWYRVYPNPVPPGGIAEVVLRLTKAACETQRRRIQVTCAGHEPVCADVRMAPPAFTLEYVGIGAGLDELHLYTRSHAGRGVSISRVEIDGRPAEADIHPAWNGLTYAKVSLPVPWQRGTYHTVAVGTRRDLRATHIRALPTPPPIGIMGNVSEREAEQYANHLFDAHVAFTSGRLSTYERLARHGLGGAYIYYRRLKPGEKKYEPVFYDQPQALDPIKRHKALWAYFLEDEPDGRYHRTALPRWSIARDVERANQFCRIHDPATPTYLQIDHGGYPRNLYIYGQIPDYICTHAYALGGDIVGRTRDHVAHTQAACRPRPFYYLNEGYCTTRSRDAKASREFSPDEMRIEVYTAVACGAKSLQWYPAHGSRGLLKHPRMWNAVGEMNGILHQVLPLISIGMPVGAAQVDADNWLTSCILCGDRAMLVVLVNRNYKSTPAEFITAPAPPATVRVRLPRFLKAAGAVRMRFPGGLPDIPAEIADATVTFKASANPVEMVLIYADESVFEQLRRTHAGCLKRYVPTPESPKGK